MSEHANDKLDNELVKILIIKKKLIKLNFCIVLSRN